MPDQVYRFNSKDDYLYSRHGSPVAKKFETWEEAQELRDLLRLIDKRNYYNIVHFGTVKIYARKTCGEESNNQGETNEKD